MKYTYFIQWPQVSVASFMKCPGWKWLRLVSVARTINRCVRDWQAPPAPHAAQLAYQHEMRRNQRARAHDTAWHPGIATGRKRLWQRRRGGGGAAPRDIDTIRGMQFTSSTIGMRISSATT
jgi:hypothetical protein